MELSKVTLHNIFILVVYILTVEAGLPPGVGVSQSQLDDLARDISISVSVVDNLKNSVVSHFVKLELHNTGTVLVPSAGWMLFFHSIYLLLPSIFPNTTTTVLEVENVRVSMYGGDLYALEPVGTFKVIEPGETREIELEAALWSVSRTDFMPNWYFVSTIPTLEPRTARSTESNLDFVKPFNNVRQWKRYHSDRYNPFTSQARMARLRVKDTRAIGKPIIPTPVFMRIKSGGRKVSVDPSWRVAIMTNDWKANELAKRTASMGFSLGTQERVRNNHGKRAISVRATEVLLYIHRHHLKAKLGILWNGLSGRPETILLSTDTLQTQNEGYGLRVDPVKNNIEITSKSEAGLFYGIQSLLSLMSTFPDGLPEIDIHDWPRFQYRGLHVDVARNFHNADDLIRLMKAMAAYKMNKLHLHLTDDEGWRLDIPDIPELTQVGGNRCHDITETKCIIPQLGSGPTTHSSGSGFFDENQYKRILDEASQNFIEVIPEFDMPGHAHAAIKSMEARYRTLFNRTAAEEYRLIDPTDTSFYISVQQWMDNAINPCIESTYKFIAKVMDTVIKYHEKTEPLNFLKAFHFGGDEVAKGAWENSTKCKEFLVEHPSYDTPKGLKQYFVERVAKLATERNLGLMGWEDAFMDQDDNPFPLTRVGNNHMTAYPWDNIWEWGESQRAYKLANAGYKVVMSQATHLYFDHPYEPDPEERGLYWAARYTDTRKTFGFLPDALYDNIDVKRSGEPLSKEDVCGANMSKCDPLLKPENIIGMQGHLWSKTIRNAEDGKLPRQQNIDEMLFPRLLALAERAWHKADFEEKGITKELRKRREKLEWEKFANTVGYKELKRLEALGLSYRVPPPGARVINGIVEFSVTFPGLAVEYSRDGGITWNEVIAGTDVLWGTQKVMHLRTRSGDKNSRVVELFEDEPLPWSDQSMINYTASNLEITAGVVDNFNKIQDKYITLQVKLFNIGEAPILRGTWKIYFHNAYGVKEEELDCGLKVTHINGDLYCMSFFIEPQPGHQVICTLHQERWNVARSDFFPNWYVSSDGMIPKTIENTKTLDYVLPYDTPQKWKRTLVDKYNPYTTEGRYKMHSKAGVSRPRQIINTVMPTPFYIKQKDDKGRVDLNDWVIVESADFPREAWYLSDTLQLHLSAAVPPRRYILFQKTNIPEQNSEAYHLVIKPRSITITAQDNQGAFYGAVSLISLWWSGKGTVPVLTIHDKPRFGYRGVMVDTARNFKPKEWILTILDVMALYKLNTLHLHLTDDESWRLEIPGIPELTEMGANRCQNHDMDLCLIPQSGTGPDTSLPGSGFYTVQDYRNILQYAASLHITVIPEIAMPGHSKAAISSMEYRDAKKENLLRRGEDVSAMKTYSLSDPLDKHDIKGKRGWMGNAMNPCLSTTYEFVHKVLDELISMHSGIMDLKSIHIGGNQVPEGSWENSPACKSSHPVSNTAILQRRFMKTVADIVASKGLDLSVWDDGVYSGGNLYPRTDFKSSLVNAYAWDNIWEDGNGKRSAQLADEGYKVILSMATHLNLDFAYEPDPEEVGLYWASRYTDTKKIFGFMPDNIFANADVTSMGEPINLAALCRNYSCPKTTKPENIIGIQGTMFSELIHTEEQMHNALFPRLLAVAERSWHKSSWEDIRDKEDRETKRRSDWKQFASKLGHHELPRLEKFNISYRIPPPGGRIFGSLLKVNTLYPNLDVERSTDKGKTWSTIGRNTYIWTGQKEVLLRTKSKPRSRLSRIVSLKRKFGKLGNEMENGREYGRFRNFALNWRTPEFPYWKWPFLQMNPN